MESKLRLQEGWATTIGSHKQMWPRLDSLTRFGCRIYFLRPLSSPRILNPGFLASVTVVCVFKELRDFYKWSPKHWRLVAAQEAEWVEVYRKVKAWDPDYKWFWSYPSGEYSRLNTAPWVWVLRLTDSTAGFIEQYKLVIVLKLSRAGSTNSPRLTVLLRSQENRLPPRLPPLPLCGLSAAEQRGSSFSAAGDPASCSGWSSLLPGCSEETLLALSSSSSDSSISGSSSLSETVPVLSGLSWDSSASSLSLRCSELIVVTSVSEQPLRFREQPLRSAAKSRAK